MGKIINQKFFLGDALTIAQSLIGKYLVRVQDGEESALMLHEVEAYDGPADLACHASRGKTPRTEIMFGSGGHFYVYFIYGIHWMLNIVVGEVDYPAAILIRGAGEISGPARLTKALSINKDINKMPAAKETGLWFEDRGVHVAKKDIIRTPRIRVDYAGDVWSKKPYRFLLNGDHPQNGH